MWSEILYVLCWPFLTQYWLQTSNCRQVSQWSTSVYLRIISLNKVKYWQFLSWSLETSSVKHLGCYKPLSAHGSHDNNALIMQETNSPSFCITECETRGYKFAAMEFGFECWCLSDPPQYDHRINSKNCNAPCPGDKSKTCGGNETMDIYDTGLPLFNGISHHLLVWNNSQLLSVYFLSMFQLSQSMHSLGVRF
jgi:hypothetical protein